VIPQERVCTYEIILVGAGIETNAKMAREANTDGNLSIAET
jgi:hypothetical protein